MKAKTKKESIRMWQIFRKCLKKGQSQNYIKVTKFDSVSKYSPKGNTRLHDLKEYMTKH